MFPFNYKDSDFKHLQYTHWKRVLGCASQALYKASLKRWDAPVSASSPSESSLVLFYTVWWLVNILGI